MTEVYSPVENIFCIPHADNFIVYAPLWGILLQGNAQFVNLFYSALHGDKDSLKEFGVANTDIFASLNHHNNPFVGSPSKCHPFTPTSVSLFLTTACTLRCRYCYASGGAAPVQMPWDMVTSVLKQIHDNAVSVRSDSMSVHFHGGGDVSAVWDLFVRAREYLYELTSPHNLTAVTSVGTNGILNQEQRLWLMSHITSATVSIDGPSDIQDYQRPMSNGTSSFPVVYETLQTFDEHDYSYGIRTTITDRSVHRMEEIVSFFCQHFNVKKIKMEPMFLRGRALKSSLKPPDAGIFVEHFRKARMIARRADRELTYSGLRTGVISNVFCKACGESCAVTPDGWVTSCYEIIDVHDPLSKIFFFGKYDRDSNRLVFDEESRQRLINLSVEHNNRCQKCFCKWHCAGDCPSKSTRFKKMFPSGVTDRCYITRELTKDDLVEMLTT